MVSPRSGELTLITRHSQEGYIVAQHVRRDLLARKRRALPRNRRGMLAQDVGDAIASQRLAMTVHEDVLLVASPRYAA